MVPKPRANALHDKAHRLAVHRGKSLQPQDVVRLCRTVQPRDQRLRRGNLRKSNDETLEVVMLVRPIDRIVADIPKILPDKGQK